MPDTKYIPPQEFHFTVEYNQQTAIEVLTGGTDFSKQRLKKIMQQGAVWHQHKSQTLRIRRATKKLLAGDQLYLYYNEQVLSAECPTPELIKDYGEYSIWHKPRGMLSQGSKWGDHCTLTRWSEKYLTPERPSFLVHRLDRATCGLMLIAHSKKAATLLSQLFEKRAISKHYQAIVHGEWQDQTQTTSIDLPIDGKRAVSHIDFLTFNRDAFFSKVNIAIETGRKHQIRYHLSQLNYPIVGDRLYGKGEIDELDLQLLAYQLSFTCPFTGQTICHTANDEELLF